MEMRWMAAAKLASKLCMILARSGELCCAIKVSVSVDLQLAALVLSAPRKLVSSSASQHWIIVSQRASIQAPKEAWLGVSAQAGCGSVLWSWVLLWVELWVELCSALLAVVVC